MNLINKNPYRILALPITANEREIARQVSTLGTSLWSGKIISFDTDFPFLSTVNRTPDLIEEAKKQIEQDDGKLFNSLFWFWENNSVDELALEVLKESNTNKAIEIWEKSIFANKNIVYKPVVLIENLIKQSSNWSEETTESHILKKNVDEYIVDRKKETSASIPCVNFDLNYNDNWTIECDTEWQDGTDDIGYGIVFGRDNGNYFTFEVSGNGYYCYDKHIEWSYNKLIPWKKSDVVKKWSTNHLQIKKVDTELTFYINEVHVDSFQSESFFGNSFGFSVNNNQKISFKNFKFCKLIEDDTYGVGMNITSKNFSGLKNLSTLYLCLASNNGTLQLDYFKKGIALAKNFFTSDNIGDYSKLMTNERYVYKAEETLHFYINDIIESLKSYLEKSNGISISQLLNAFSTFPVEARQFLSNRFVAKPIQNIYKEIENAEIERSSTPDAAAATGKKLIRNTKSDFEFIKNVLSKNDFEYSIIADKLALAIVRCGIEFYNATKDDEIYLYEYQVAVSIAVTERAKEKAKANLDSCYVNIIDKKIETARITRRNSPEMATDAGKYLVSNTKTDIASFKNILEESDYQLIADKLAMEIIQCGIDAFNICKDAKGEIDYIQAIRSEESYVNEYEYALNIAATQEAKERANENLESCKKYIENKHHYYCWFCGTNPPNDAYKFEITIYKETYRSYFPGKVGFSYVPFTIPRCRECKDYHDKISNRFTLITIGGAIIGCIIAAFASEGGEYWFLGLIVGGAIGWFIKEGLKSQELSKSIIKDTSQSTISKYPGLRKKIKEGWTFSKPSA